MLTNELTRRGLALRVKGTPDDGYILGISPRNRVTDNIRDFAQAHKPEILNELFDIGIAAAQKQLVTCGSCGAPARWWLNQDSNTGKVIPWWICEECGRIHRAGM